MVENIYILQFSGKIGLLFIGKYAANILHIYSTASDSLLLVNDKLQYTSIYKQCVDIYKY